MSSPAVQTGWFSRFTTGELRRRGYHMLPGFLPFLLWFIPHRDPVAPLLKGILIAIAVCIGWRFLRRFSEMRRSGHDSAAMSVIGYVVSFLAAVLLFPEHIQIALAVLAILAFGDGSATLCGLAIPSAPLPWNPRKSWSGILGFVAVALPMASIIYWGERFNPWSADIHVPLATAVACVAPAVVLSALIESLPMRLNDNIRVGATSLAAVAAMHGFLIGL